MAVKTVVIDINHVGQRVDNFLLSHCKGVPKTRIYRAVRKGEVRINQKRVQADYRLQEKDEVRIPPFRVGVVVEKAKSAPQLLQQIEQAILKETNDYLIVDKPSGLPVHGGSGIHTGLIEGLRELRPKAKFLELVHRLDKETSGCILIAKKRSVLVALHELLVKKQMSKRYLALVKGHLSTVETVTAPLQKNQLEGGERIVTVMAEGKLAKTIFHPVLHFHGATLVEAQPITGRTHQIRVHAAYMGHPIAMDSKYGDREFNQWVKKKGLRRLFLHAASLTCRWSLEDKEEQIGICVPLSAELKAVLLALGKEVSKG